jgi:hypothetical protein
VTPGVLAELEAAAPRLAGAVDTLRLDVAALRRLLVTGGVVDEEQLARVRAVVEAEAERRVALTAAVAGAFTRIRRTLGGR